MRLGACVMVAVLMGCGAEAEVGDDAAIAESAEALRSFNGMLPERIDEAMLRDGRLTRVLDAASKRALLALIATKEGRQLVRYVTGCANPGGTVLRLADAAGKTWGFRGGAGLAPAWLSRTLTDAERTAVSACLFAHINAFGIVVPLSLRGPFASLSLTANERRLYAIEEAAFYGDATLPSARLACTGKGAFDPADASSPYMQQRVCARSAACGLTLPGPCGPYDSTRRRACEKTGANGQQLDCHADVAAAGAAFTTPARAGVTTYLKRVDLGYLWALVRGQVTLPTDCATECATLVLQDAQPVCMPCPIWRLALDDLGVFSCRPREELEPEAEPVCGGASPGGNTQPPVGSGELPPRPGRSGKGDEVTAAEDTAAASGGCSTAPGASGPWLLALGLVGALRRRRRAS